MHSYSISSLIECDKLHRRICNCLIKNLTNSFEKASGSSTTKIIFPLLFKINKFLFIYDFITLLYFFPF